MEVKKREIQTLFRKVYLRKLATLAVCQEIIDFLHPENAIHFLRSSNKLQDKGKFYEVMAVGRLESNLE